MITLTNQKPILNLLWLLLFFAPLGYSDTVDDTRAVYPVSESRYVKITCPKPGFVGAPPNFAGFPDVHQPVSDKHFNTHYGKLTITDHRNLNPGLRIVLRFDEVDEKGEILHEKLFFYYINVFDDKRFMCTKDFDDNRPGGVSSVIRYGIPSPFTCSLIPDVFLKEEDSEGYYTFGYASLFSRSREKSQLDTTVMTVKLLRNREDKTLRGKDYFHLDQTRREQVQTDPESKRIFTETQTWNNNDWLWKRMERKNSKGHVLMKCERIDRE